MRTALAMLVMLMSGCSTAYAVRPSALVALDGWDSKVDPTPRPVEALNPKFGTVKFDGRNLVLAPRGAARVTGEFLTLKVDDQRLLGTLADGRTIDLALDQLRAVRLMELSSKKSAGASLAVIGGLAAAVLGGFLVAGIVILSTSRCFLVCGG